MKIVNDKYYTPINVANHCIDKVLEIIGKDNISQVVEPSVGGGAFLHHPDLQVHLAYDIAPECTDENVNIITGDFLSQDITYLPNRLVIGNPPFGSRLHAAQMFYKKAVEIADYIAFILPISQLNNSHSMYEFNLIYSEDLGKQIYSDRELHCCFNLYSRPEVAHTNNKNKFSAITIYHDNKKDYNLISDYDFRMCRWGSNIGKILNDADPITNEYKIKINDTNHYNDIYNCLTTYDWKNYCEYISTPYLLQWHIIDVLLKELPYLQNFKLDKNSRPDNKLQSITIYRDRRNGFDECDDFDVRMCYWGNGSAGKILYDENEHYCAEYKIKINDKEYYDRIYEVLTTFDWKEYVSCVAMKKLQQFHIYDVLLQEIPELREVEKHYLDDGQNIKRTKLI